MTDKLNTIYGFKVDRDVVKANLRRIVNQTYKLLPLREEEEDWEKPLVTLLIELTGMFDLLPDLKEGLKVISKLRGILDLEDGVAFYDYRRTIFECCSIISKLEQSI